MAHLRSDFRVKLKTFVDCAITVLLDDEEGDPLLVAHLGILIPRMFRLYTRVWMKRPLDLIKK